MKQKALAKLQLKFQKAKLHSGENRSPDDPQMLENTGFRLSPE
jgi:hypothetical protein